MREISLHVLDILQNSVAAGASCIRLHITQSRARDRLEIVIEDDGCGIEEERLIHILDPFTTSRTTRKVGMGLPMFQASANRAGGSLNIRSQAGSGTRVTARYCLSHIDRPPLGDLAGTVVLQAVGSPQIRLIFILTTDDGEFTMDTQHVAQVLGPQVPLSDPAVAQWIKEYINEGIQSVNGGA